MRFLLWTKIGAYVKSPPAFDLAVGFYKTEQFGNRPLSSEPAAK
jgi:hypothetical protein